MICNLCGLNFLEKLYCILDGYQVIRCKNCGLIFLFPFIPKDRLLQIYNNGYYHSWGMNLEGGVSRKLKELLYARILSEVIRYIRPGRVLDVGSAFGDSLGIAQNMGWDPFGVEISDEAYGFADAKYPGKIYHGDFSEVDLPKGYFDLVIMSDFIEHSYNLIENIRKASNILKQTGLIAILTPDVNSLSAKLMRRSWIHFKEEHLYYLSAKSLQLLFEKSGLRPVVFKAFRKPINFYYFLNQVKYYGAKYQYAALKLIGGMLPPAIRSLNIYAPQGEIFALAEKI